MKTQSNLAIFLILITLTLILIPSESYAFTYTVKANVNMRSGPGTGYKVKKMLRHNQTLTLLKKENGWTRVKTISDETGYVRNDMISDLRIKVHKKERKLYLIKGENTIIKTCKTGLSSLNTAKDKKILGDGGTPEGRFFLCEMIKTPAKPKYGARSMRISYPNIEDARRGLRNKTISMDQYLGIVKNIRLGKMPDQGTKLGGSIRIHGGGSSSDWTLGCIALSDNDIREIYKHLKKGIRVEIFKSKHHDKSLNSPGSVNKKILAGARKQLNDPALYTLNATNVIRLSYPNGDISKTEAVCTDIVIRSLRNAGLDLQSLLYEDAVLNPDAYKPEIKRPSYHIDHRRVRTLKKYFDQFTENLSHKPHRAKPGDIVIMDTGIQNGTKCDHIGIVGNTRDSNGNFNVINIWTVGERTEPLSLIGRDYPEIAYYYRMGHVFEYDAI